LNYTWFDWTTEGTYNVSEYPYLTLIANNYEGCLITLVWNHIYDAANARVKFQVQRATYTIKSRVNYVHSFATEFVALNTTVYNKTTSIGSTALQTNYWPACRIHNRYYWNPYKKLYFFMDRYASLNQIIVFTCFPYNTGPNAACDADFTLGGTPTFKLSGVLNTPNTNGAIDFFPEIVVFSRNTAYIAARYKVDGTYWQARIYKLVFGGSSCTDYTATLGALIYSSSNGVSANDITGLGVIP